MNLHLVRGADRDYRAFLAKIAGGATYETKDDPDEVKTLVAGIKDSIAEGLTGLKSEIKSVAERQDKLETAFKRAPGAKGDGVKEESIEAKGVRFWIKQGGNKDLREFFSTEPEYKAVVAQVGSDPGGGYAVLPEMAASVYRLQKQIDPIRQVASTVTIQSDAWEELLSRGTVSSTWTSETGSRADSDTPQLEKFRVPVHEHYAMPVATQQILDDASFSVEDWLNTEVAEGMALAESAAFVSGNGVGRPEGFTTLSRGTAADATRGWGTIGVITTGVAAAFGTSASAGLAYADPFDNIVGALKPIYRQNAVWLMNSTTLAEINKIKDANGRSLIVDNLQSGQATTIRGFPVVVCENIASIGTETAPVWFGDFKTGYRIVDRQGIRILRDPYTSKPNVKFYTTKRVGGAVRNSEAIKAMVTGTGVGS